MATQSRVPGAASSAVDFELELAPRPGYGVGTPTLEHFDGGVAARSGDEGVALSSSVPLHITGGSASARFTVNLQTKPGWFVNASPAYYLLDYYAGYVQDEFRTS